MKLHSFRLRIALLSALLAGSVLAVFGGVSWWLIYQTKLNRIDDAIKDQLLRESDRPRPDAHWQPYFDSLGITFNTKTPNELALLVQNSIGQTIYQSTTWTAALTRSALFPAHPPASPFSPQRLPQPDRPPPPGQALPGQPRPLQLPGLNPLQQPPVPPQDASGRVRPRGQLSRIKTQSTGTGDWRVGTVIVPTVRIALAVNLRTIETEMNAIRNAYLITIPLLLVVIAIGSWWLSGSALKPLDDVTATLRRVTAKGLDQRVPISSSDREFVELLRVFNQMMERLERSFTQASRFSADAAHELKTPLAILQGELERSLQAAEPGSDLQQCLGSLLDEVRRLGVIVRKLLLLSLADAGQMRLNKQAVDLSELLDELTTDIEMLAPELQVQTQIEPALTVQADQALLIQVLQNLMSNAVKYNLPKGWIKITARHQKSMIFVTISNRSKGIPPSERPYIFERFHRGDPARTRHVEGIGLGLSLAREIAQAHGGNLVLETTPTDQAAFTLTLPLNA